MKLFLFPFILLLVPFFLFAQDETDEKPLTKNQAKNEALQLQLDAANQALLFADSLYDNGSELVKESKANIKMIEADKKEAIANYKIKRKELSKQVTGDDKAATAKKTADLKELDATHKEKIKSFDADKKINLKKLSLGEKMYAKGEDKKKAAKDKLKILNESLKEFENKSE